MGNLIKELRGKLSQQELADRVGITQGAISRYESETRYADPPEIDRIAAAVGKKVEWIIKDIEKENHNEIKV